MFPSEEVFKICLNQLKNNQIIVITINGIYYLATLGGEIGRQNLEKITQKGGRIEYLFRDQLQLSRFANFPKWSSFLLEEILPNHLTCLLPAKNQNETENKIENQENQTTQEINLQKLKNLQTQNSKTSQTQTSEIPSGENSKIELIYCNKTSHYYNQKLLNLLENPLVITKATVGGEIPATNLSMLRSYFGESVHYFLPTKYEVTGIGPTLLRINENSVEIIERGILGSTDFAPFLPSEIPITENLELTNLQSIYETVKPINLVKTYTPKNNEALVILATKEKIRQTFDLNPVSLLSFHHKMYQNKVLINLGSQTNLENVARHLSQKIFEAKNLGMKIIILDQNWGQNKWGKIIDFYLQKYTETEIPNNQTDDLQTNINPDLTLQKIKQIKPKETFIKKIKQSLDNLNPKKARE